MPESDRSRRRGGWPVPVKVESGMLVQRGVFGIYRSIGVHSLALLARYPTRREHPVLHRPAQAACLDAHKSDACGVGTSCCVVFDQILSLLANTPPAPEPILLLLTSLHCPQHPPLSNHAQRPMEDTAKKDEKDSPPLQIDPKWCVRLLHGEISN